MTTRPTLWHEFQTFRPTLARLGRAIVAFGRGSAGREARARATLLLVLLLTINSLTVVNSYVGRDFMTAIERRNWAGFVWESTLYVIVLGLLTIVTVFSSFTEQRLGLLWREWITRNAVGMYLVDHRYYFMNASGTLTNPDQRIADDVRTFTTMSLSLTIIFFNSVISVIAFSGVLWSISHLLFVVAVLYAGIGSVLAIYLGRPLVHLNYDQEDKEANFRADLIHVRENTESVALAHREAQIRRGLLARVEDFTSNLKRIIGVNRNLGFFTTGYNYMVQLIPVLIVAPMFIRGTAQFGEISQSVVAFANILGAFSVIVNQFPSLSTYAAVLSRLSPIAGIAEAPGPPPESGITVVEDESRLAFENLTLRTPNGEQFLVRALTVDVRARKRVLVSAAIALATNALQRAIAGIWNTGEGRIVRPSLEGVTLLPDRPYVPPGTLRAFLCGSSEAAVPDDVLQTALHTAGAASAVERAGGLDVVHDWDDLLSIEEQRLIGLAQLLTVPPRFAVIMHLGEGLGADGAQRLLDALVQHGVGCLALGDGVLHHQDFDAVIQINADGSWTQTASREEG